MKISNIWPNNSIKCGINKMLCKREFTCCPFGGDQTSSRTNIFSVFVKLLILTKCVLLALPFTGRRLTCATWLARAPVPGLQPIIQLAALE